MATGPHLLFFIAFITSTLSVWASEPFPSGALPAYSIGGKLPSNHETSGIVWHSGIQKFFLVSDNGIVTSMSSKGTKLTHWEINSDLEAVTVAHPKSDFIYLGIEDPDGIYEFNFKTGQVTRIFDLTRWINGPSNSGMEALAFVSDAEDPEGGLFYAGLQNTGQIFVFRLPIHSSSTSTDVTYIQTIPPIDNINNISDLAYVPSQCILYAIYDKDNILRAMEPNGSLIFECFLPGEGQEGIALKGSELYISQDYGNDGGDVLRYSPFAPLPQPDIDADGTVTLSDFTLLATYWNCEAPPVSADIDGNDRVDVADFTLFAEYWLHGL